MIWLNIKELKRVRFSKSLIEGLGHPQTTYDVKRRSRLISVITIF